LNSIPIVYYGQEQGFHGAADPYNREPMWPSKYETSTAAYGLITKLNQLRNHLVATSDWAAQPAQVLTTSPEGIALMKGPVLSMLTTIGSPPQAVALGSYTPWQASAATTDVLTCTQYAVGAGGTINVQYSQGGRPVILVPNADLVGSGICTDQVEKSIGHTTSAATKDNGARAGGSRPGALAVLAAGLLAAWAWA
jgi:alpha-amylase